jgi:hypothetical protein
MTHSLTLDLPEEIYQPLLKTALTNGKKVEDVAVEVLASLKRKNFTDPFERFIGSVKSDITDLAENHDKYIGENLAQDLNGKK